MGAAEKINDIFQEKLEKYGLVLVKINSIERQVCNAQLGRVYRIENLFESRSAASKLSGFEFVGGGGTWGDLSNYSGEIGLAFICSLRGKYYQDYWHGHIPIKRHEDGFWGFLYGIQLWEMKDVPSILRENSKPNQERLLKSTGQPYDTWVKFEALEIHLMELVSELEKTPCISMEISNVEEWMGSLPKT